MKMSKGEFKSNSRVNQIFEDLEQYLNFCRDFGYRYDEADLYNNRSFAFRQYTKFLQGKPAKDMWEVDGKPI
jgi:hypothetical protein